jgi:enoyl-CoA hydratase/carnithine racemase
VSDVVLYERDGRIARVTLNRPERLNAIDETMPRALAAAVARAGADDEVHVIVLSGAGRAFCSGYDLERFAETPRPTLGSQVFYLLNRQLKPQINQKEAQFFARIKKNRVDPTNSSAANPGKFALR